MSVEDSTVLTIRFNTHGFTDLGGDGLINADDAG